MVELADGSVMLNSRKWGGKALRKVATRQDSGVTWSKIVENASLRDPGCMALIFRYTFLRNATKTACSFPVPTARSVTTARFV